MWAWRRGDGGGFSGVSDGNCQGLLTIDLGINKIKGPVCKIWWHLMVRDRKKELHTLTNATVLSTSVDIDNFFEKTKYLHFRHLSESKATIFFVQGQIYP